MKLSKFVGVTTPIQDLAVAIQNQGWQLSSVQFDSQLNAFKAEAISPHGEKLEKTGPDAGTATANTLLAVTRRNHMRSAAQYKVGMWRTNWHERLPDIAEAYRDAPIYDPKAVAAWKLLADDSMHRLHVLGGQLHIEPTNEPQPYATADDMRKDVHEKRHYYLSKAGTAHPVWTADQVSAFRAVHDILGHGVAGGHYDWPGRNLAAAAHAPLLEPLAQQALFAETVGRQAFLQTYGHGPQKIALFPDFVDHHQGLNQAPSHRGIHPSQTTAPVALPKGFVLSKTAAANTIDVNKGWDSGVDPLEYNAFVHHGDPMEWKKTVDNAGLIDTGWSEFKRGDGSDDRDRMKLAIVNAFRVVLLSPRKDLRWNAIHYQDISHIPGTVDDPKVYWETLEKARRKWNEAQGIDPNAHMIYFKFLKPFQAHIAAQHPEKGWAWAQQEADQTLFNWWTEEQERIAADDSMKPPEKQRTADEIERRANEALAKRMQEFLKPKDDKADVEDDQMGMALFAKKGDDPELDAIIKSIVGEQVEEANRRVRERESEWEKNRRAWQQQRDREREEERTLFKRDPQAYYEKLWGGRGDVDHPYHSQYVEWVPTQAMLPFAEWKRNPAHGAPAGESATQQYWDILKANILRDGIKNPIHLYVHPHDRMGHIGEGNHRLAVADALGMTHVPVTVHRSKRRGNSQAPVPQYDDQRLRYAEIIKPSQIGLPVQKTAADKGPSAELQEKLYREQMGEREFQKKPKIPGGAKPLNIMTGEDSLKYGAFMGTHLKSISQVSQHADEILDAALADVREHDATGHHFRHEVLALGVPGVGPKVCSFAWLLLQPLTSQLATIDVHMMDVLGHNYEKEMNNRDYFKFEREFRAGLDAAGYGGMPLGAAQWGMWDYKRTGPGTHQDHSAMRVIDPKPHNEVPWASKAPTTTEFKKNWADSVDWWAATKAHRDQVGQEFDQTYGKSFKKNVVPHQDLGTNAKIAGYDEPFSYYWDRAMPVGSSLDSKARTLAEYAKADKLTEDKYEDWLDDHKKDTRLDDSSFKRFKKKTLAKFHRLSKVAMTSPTPVMTHPESGEQLTGMPGQSMMEHARLQTGLSTQEVWRLLGDEHVQKV